MNNQIDDMKKIWQDSRKNDLMNTADKYKIINVAQKKMKQTIRMQLGTIAILTLTLAILALYFFYAVHFQKAISQIGASLMMGAILVRIILELFSIHLSAKVDLTHSAKDVNSAAMNYHRFRKIINGPVTIILVILYSAGFYLLTPEFMLFFNLPVVILLDASYILIAFVFIRMIRRTVRKEMLILDEILNIQQSLDN